MGVVFGFGEVGIVGCVEMVGTENLAPSLYYT